MWLVSIGLRLWDGPYRAGYIADRDVTVSFLENFFTIHFSFSLYHDDSFDIDNDRYTSKSIH